MKGILMKPDVLKAKLKVLEQYGKAQTRRVIKPQPHKSWDKTPYLIEATGFFCFHGHDGWGYKKPRYQVGEVVYIKEAWQVLDMDTRTLRDKVHRVKVEYKVDGFVNWTMMPATISYTIPDKWHSPLHLAEITARYFIKIKDVRAERLQEITPTDCEAEGIDGKNMLDPYIKNDYSILWDSINKPHRKLKSIRLEKVIKPPYDWQSNPWVWVYTFSLGEKGK